MPRHAAPARDGEGGAPNHRNVGDERQQADEDGVKLGVEGEVRRCARGFGEREKLQVQERQPRDGGREYVGPGRAQRLLERRYDLECLHHDAQRLERADGEGDEARDGRAVVKAAAARAPPPAAAAVLRPARCAAAGGRRRERAQAARLAARARHGWGRRAAVCGLRALRHIQRRRKKRVVLRIAGGGAWRARRAGRLRGAIIACGARGLGIATRVRRVTPANLHTQRRACGERTGGTATTTAEERRDGGGGCAAKAPAAPCDESAAAPGLETCAAPRADARGGAAAAKQARPRVVAARRDVAWTHPAGKRGATMNGAVRRTNNKKTPAPRSASLLFDHRVADAPAGQGAQDDPWRA